MKNQYIPKTELEKIIIDNPDEEWVWEYLSRNPNITMDFIEFYPEKPWDWIFLSLNPELTLDMVKKNLDKNWKWLWVSSRPNISINDIVDNPDLPWDWSGVSWHPYINSHIIKKYPDKKWDWQGISQSGNLDINFIRENLDKPLIWYNISQNTKLNIDKIKNNIDLPWDWDGFAKNKTLSTKFIDYFKDKKWDWSMLSYNKICYDINFIKEYKDKSWNWDILSKNFSENDKKNNYTLPWVEIDNSSILPSYDKDLISRLSFLIENDDNLKSCLIFKYYISLNKNITSKFIKKYQHIGWKWDLISDNIFNYYKKDKPYYYSNYRKLQCLYINKTIEKELLAYTWNPIRLFDWCLDIEEKNNLTKSINYF